MAGTVSVRVYVRGARDNLAPHAPTRPETSARPPGERAPGVWPCAYACACPVRRVSGSMKLAWVGPLFRISGLGDTAVSFPRGRRFGPGGARPPGPTCVRAAPPGCRSGGRVGVGAVGLWTFGPAGLRMWGGGLVSRLPSPGFCLGGSGLWASVACLWPFVSGPCCLGFWSLAFRIPGSSAPPIPSRGRLVPAPSSPRGVAPSLLAWGFEAGTGLRVRPGLEGLVRSCPGELSASLCCAGGGYRAWGGPGRGESLGRVVWAGACA